MIRLQYKIGICVSFIWVLFAIWGWPRFRHENIIKDESVPLTDPYKFLFLMGREKYAGANSYDYYAVEKTSEGNGVLKFNLPRITREYNSGDEIYIHELKRKYRVRMDELDGFRYDPYIIF